MIRTLLSVSSYAFLNLVLLIRFWLEPIGYINAALLLISLISVAVLTRAPLRKNAGDTYTVKKIDDQGQNVAAYAATFILPLIGINGSDGRDIAVFCILYAMSIFLGVQTGLGKINPTFLLAGKRLLEVQVGSEQAILVLSRKRVNAGDRVNLVRLFDDLYQVKKEGA